MIFLLLFNANQIHLLENENDNSIKSQKYLSLKLHLYNINYSSKRIDIFHHKRQTMKITLWNEKDDPK